MHLTIVVYTPNVNKNKGVKQWKLQRLVSKNDLHMVVGPLAVR